jgi:hypothetical protein
MELIFIKRERAAAVDLKKLPKTLVRIHGAEDDSRAQERSERKRVEPEWGMETNSHPRGVAREPLNFCCTQQK